MEASAAQAYSSNISEQNTRLIVSCIFKIFAHQIKNPVAKNTRLT